MKKRPHMFSSASFKLGALTALMAIQTLGKPPVQAVWLTA